jgi:hypothetical protein
MRTIRSSGPQPAVGGSEPMAPAVMSMPITAKSPLASSQMSGHFSRAMVWAPPACGSGPMRRRKLKSGFACGTSDGEFWDVTIPKYVPPPPPAQVKHPIRLILNEMQKTGSNFMGFSGAIRLIRHRFAESHRASLSATNVRGVAKRSRDKAMSFSGRPMQFTNGGRLLARQGVLLTPSSKSLTTISKRPRSTNCAATNSFPNSAWSTSASV